MLRTMMKSKIHRATVTQADLHRVGSVTVDEDLMDAADLLAGERVAIVDVTSGARLETHVVAGARGSGVIGVNGERWMLRASFLGKPAVDPDSTSDWEDALAQIVVRRGDQAMPVGEFQMQSRSRIAWIDRLGEGMLPTRETVLQEGDMLHIVIREENAAHAYAVLESGPEDD